MLKRCELHCHSEYSWDCDTSLERIIERCRARKIDVIALTDHDQVAGSKKLQEIAPDFLQVIVAQEITTRQGHLIGLFLSERIEPGKDVEESIEAIRKQGGLVLLPHPFDRLRGAVGLQVAERIKDKIDLIEVFNARCLFPSSNAQALEFAKKHNLVGYAGSDAHTVSEYGNATNLIEAFSTKEEFLENMRKAELTTRLSSKLVYALSEVVKMRNRLRKKPKP